MNDSDDGAKPTTHALLIGLLLATALLAGCIGSDERADDGVGTAGSQEGSPCRTMERTKEMEGAVTPMEPSTKTASIDGTNVTFGLQGSASGRGGLQFTLERDGQEVWAERANGPTTVANDYLLGYQLSGLDAGNYTLKISTETGYYDIQATLAFAWGTGDCS